AAKLFRFWLLCQRGSTIDLEGKSLASYFVCSQTGVADPEVVERFGSHMNAGLQGFGSWRKGLFGMMLKYMNKLPDQQLLMQFGGYQPVETSVALFAAVTAAAQAARIGDTASVDALDLQCELLRCQLTHKDPTSPRLIAAMDRVYEHVKEGRFHQLFGTTIYPVLQPVVNRETFDSMMDAAAAGQKFAYPVGQEPIPYHEWVANRQGAVHYRPIRCTSGESVASAS
ncbi:MAG: hypothetical protein JST44_27090, partial [Cyanobacteria bacterium SZAS LIN-5]|nr:hypothetical protein [Cyanobacteria bacterium SZAS LIN-5]